MSSRVLRPASLADFSMPRGMSFGSLEYKRRFYPSQPLGGYDSVVAVGQQPSSRLMDDDERLRQAFFQLVDPAFQLVRKNFSLGRHQVVNVDFASYDGNVDVVERLQRFLELPDLLRVRPLDLGTDDVRVRDDAHEVSLIVHDRQLADAQPENHPGHFVDLHVRDAPR